MYNTMLRKLYIGLLRMKNFTIDFTKFHYVRTYKFRTMGDIELFCRFSKFSIFQVMEALFDVAMLEYNFRLFVYFAFNIVLRSSTFSFF